jgi:P-type conjugative transfer protein TrbJ
MRTPRCLAAVLVLFGLLLTLPARAIIVFDPSNFVQNSLTAARTLEEINNQLRQLQNEAQMLINQARNLASLPFSIVAQLRATLATTNALIQRASGVTFQLGQSHFEFNRVHPGWYGPWSTAIGMANDAQDRWFESLWALQTTVDMQSQAAENLPLDEDALTTLVDQSQSAIGALQAIQATNQLLALQARQAIQQQQLELTQSRSEALERARKVADEARAREVRRRFQGSGVRYTAPQVDFYGF